MTAKLATATTLFLLLTWLACSRIIEQHDAAGALMLETVTVEKQILEMQLDVERKRTRRLMSQVH